ncbi:MAG: O-antigen ligase family protein [Deltaproteobacteria bacterium]|nr:O-antigen ligase family protein [Deltaproteobacteria bacterium]
MTKILPLIPRYAIYTLLVFTPLARASVQPWAITTIHIITLIALTAFLLEKTLTNNYQWISTPLDVPFGCLLLLCLLSTLFSLHPRTSFWSTTLLLNYIAIFYLVIHTFRTRSQLRHLVYLIIGIAVFLSIFGFFKKAGINLFPWWDYTDLPQRVRLTATFGNPDHLAGYMEMAIPLLLGLLLLGHRRAVTVLLVYLSFLLLTALVLSLSRGSWVGMLTGLLLMAICLLLDRHFTHKRLIIGLMTGTLAVALIVLASTPVVERILTMTENGIEPNLETRMRVWSSTTDVIAEYPLIGTGLGTYALTFIKYQPPGLTTQFTMAHNDYVHLVSEAGLPLIAIIVWMMIALYRKGFHKLKNPSRLVRGTTLGAMAGITAILVHSFVDFNLHIGANALLLTVLAALVAAPLPISNGLSNRSKART